MSTLVVAVVSLLLGGVVGFFARAAEFRRDQRLKVYGDFIAAFLDAAHEGSAMYSIAVQYGMDSTEARSLLGERWLAFGSALQRFEESTARLRLVGSTTAVRQSEQLEKFIASNVRAVPPLHRGDEDQWGSAAKVGPSKVDSEAVRLGREFADVAGADVTTLRCRR